MLKWRLKIKDELDLNKPKKVKDVAEVPEDSVAIVKPLVDSAVAKTESDLENEEDKKLEEQIKDALHSEKLLDKK